MSSPIYFISDIHLGAHNQLGDDDVKIARLDALFDQIAEQGARLFILGDLFDFWFEYNTVVQKDHLVIIEMLAKLRRRGIQIDLLVGNHDFWVGRFFKHHLGINIHRDPFELQIADKIIFLAHGDGLGKGDLGYKAIKVLLRNPFTIWLYGLIHPDIAVPLAKWFSKISRNCHQPLDPKPLIDFAELKFSQGYDHVVMGHIHLPVIHQQNGHSYLNLGDFITHFSYGIYQNGILSLEYLQ